MGAKWFILLVFLAACQGGITGDVIDMMDEELTLFIEPSDVREDRGEYIKLLRKQGRKNRRPLYEKYIDVIGANGILDGIEILWPKCHSQAHDAGKIIYSHVSDIGQGLGICEDRCYSGCMHGVLMEAFKEYQDSDDPDGHIDIEAMKPAMDDLCYENEEMTGDYSPGDCAHGVGHAVMFLTDYDIPEAVELCKQFDDTAMKYYCATGTYMEYVTENDKKDSETKSLMYPCDQYDYPGACSRYKMVHVVRRHIKDDGKISELIENCEKLEGKHRLGCFHGLGNSMMGPIALGKVDIKNLCFSGSDDEQFLCIEGAMERMAKYHLEKAEKVCSALEGRQKKICDTAIDQGMYNMEKDFTLYVAE